MSGYRCSKCHKDSRGAFYAFNDRTGAFTYKCSCGHHVRLRLRRSFRISLEALKASFKAGTITDRDYTDAAYALYNADGMNREKDAQPDNDRTFLKACGIQAETAPVATRPGVRQ